MHVFSLEVENELTVDEMIGVLKWLRIVKRYECEDLYDSLIEWQSEGYGEVIVASCKSTLQ